MKWALKNKCKIGLIECVYILDIPDNLKISDEIIGFIDPSYLLLKMHNVAKF